MTKPHPMQQFHDMLEHILEQGTQQPNRTGVDAISVPGYHLNFDMRDGFPAITTKKLAFKAAVGETIGFFRGFTSAAQFREIGCKVWDGNANETAAWLKNPNRKGPDDCGRIYGSQWTEWRDWQEARTPERADELRAAGYEQIAYDSVARVWVFRKGINQLENALRTLMTNPTDRGILVSAWRPDEFNQMALRPCHVLWNWIADSKTNSLHLCMYQRSFDTFLAFNVAMGGLMLSIMAKLAGMTPRLFHHFIGNAHVYTWHRSQVETLLSRDHRPQPTLHLGESIPTLKSVDEIPGVFTRIQPDDIWLEGYDPHPAIKAPMAA